MKKILSTGIIAAVILIGGVSIINADSKENNEAIVKDQAIQSEQFGQTKEKAANSDILSIARVKEIALSEQNGRIDEIELEQDDGYTYYEVEIENANKEYEIYIEAYTGEVLKVELDDRDDDHMKEKKDLEKIISVDEAEKIAIEQFGGKVVALELDEDDHRYEYEIELKTNNGEVEVIIDALSGDIIEIDK